MNFNTAIFYDIENLLKGYGFSQNLVSNLSLKDILEEIKASNKIGRISVQRAYANWSDPRLGFLKNEILELGIDPIQVFGFLQGPRKNAADIQLAIDTVEMALQKPSLENFVIISGDGGFASLAKKLHEYGKNVLAAAYKNATNKVLANVCDEMIWIEDPEAGSTGQVVKNENLNFINDPRIYRMAQNIKPTYESTNKAVLQKVNEILQWFKNEKEINKELISKGIPLSVVKEAFNYAIVGFSTLSFGFAKFVEFMQFVCKETDLACFSVYSSGAKLAYRNINSIGQALPDLNSRETHSVEFYKSVLEKVHPIFKVVDCNSLKKVAFCITENPPEKLLFGEMIEHYFLLLENSVDREEVKASVLNFLSAEIFERIPSDALLSEQKLLLKPEFNSESSILEKLFGVMKEKITRNLGEVRETIFKELICL